ncbi:MAG: right-handed parallel beta-helix repeat-containing protein [Bacteroidales bacterium]|nr:right-handed parallel beta-helix repeat-containing protein [Bacteroidales bacterium]
MKRYLIFMVIFCLMLVYPANGTTYYVDAEAGDDAHPGTSVIQPFRTLEKIRELQLLPGDSICLAAGQVFRGSLVLRDVRGTADYPVVVTSYSAGTDSYGEVHDSYPAGHDSHLTGYALATIDAAGYPDGILVVNGANIRLGHIRITANGTVGGHSRGNGPGKTGGNQAAGESITAGKSASAGKSLPAGAPDMRCGIRITADKQGVFENIQVHDVHIIDIFYHEPGHTRSKGEVRTANGSGRYGWGIRLINQVPGAVLQNLRISDSHVTNVSHTGIKLTARKEGIRDVVISGCKVLLTGGPGIQMSGVRQVIASNNLVDRSGSNDDSRKWGRGSGLWTWGSSDVLIEHNQFKNAKGPGDSAGCHIDFNCSNVIVQYNFSYHNAGGFIEILGNNYNCAYRYNISVNDGYRIKGQDGAFQEGKIFWLSGYQGDREQKGPFNSYIYNNTVFTDQDIVAKIAVTKTAAGVLVANNIFCLTGGSLAVKGDQYRPEREGQGKVPRVTFRNNLFLDPSDWPDEVLIHDEAPLYGNPEFSTPGGDQMKDYVPGNKSLVKDKGMFIPRLPGDEVGLVPGLRVMHDIFGNQVKGTPDIGAIEL